jgi:hypothetical protein
MKKQPIRSTLGAWLLFFGVGGGMWFLRYGDVLSADRMAVLITYGPYLVLFMHVALTLLAFQDTVFQGILCLLIPFYSLYYIFMVSDAFYIRALCGGLLVGLGADAAVFFQETSSEVIAKVNAWISSGGGAPNRLP